MMRRAKVTITEMLGIVSVSVSMYETARNQDYTETHLFSYTTTLDALDGLSASDLLRDGLVVAIENRP